MNKDSLHSDARGESDGGALPQGVRSPIISLWGPWASWVMLGWKPIETRTHRRFESLAGKRIGIHVAIKWDKEALTLAAPYLNYRQIARTKEFLRAGGAIIGTAFVKEHRKLTAEDSHLALIDCGSVERWGLILEDVRTIPCIPCPGKQGIWYYNLPSEYLLAGRDPVTDGACNKA